MLLDQEQQRRLDKQMVFNEILPKHHYSWPMICKLVRVYKEQAHEWSKKERSLVQEFVYTRDFKFYHSKCTFEQIARAYEDARNRCKAGHTQEYWNKVNEDWQLDLELYYKISMLGRERIHSN